MNVFYLDSNPLFAARYHNDKHCVKMIVESCQLLSTALREHGVIDDRLYKSTHKNHPSAIWARSSVHNYSWLISLTGYLLLEYTIRYGKEHKCTEKLDVFIEYIDKIPYGEFTVPPQCMPDECKCDDTVQAYRNYYMKHKRHIAQWKTNTPEWFV